MTADNLSSPSRSWLRPDQTTALPVEVRPSGLTTEADDHYDQGAADGALLVTPDEAARRLSIGRTTLYALLASGELSSVTIGRSRRVPVASLRTFVTRLVAGDPVKLEVPSASTMSDSTPPRYHERSSASRRVERTIT